MFRGYVISAIFFTGVFYSHLFANGQRKFDLQVNWKNMPDVNFGGKKAPKLRVNSIASSTESSDVPREELVTTCEDVLTCGAVSMKVERDAFSMEESQDEKKELEKNWKLAYDFVSGLGVTSPSVIQTTTVSFPIDKQWLNEYLWLGDIRIGGISESTDTIYPLKSQDEVIQSEIERVKIQKFTSPTESLGGEGGGFIEMREVEGYDPVDTRYIPQRCGSVILVPKVEKH